MATSGTMKRPELFDYYRYDPSRVAAVIFAVCFFFTTFVHIHQTAGCRTFYFIPLLIGGFFEVGGYVLRILAHDQKNNLGIFIAQTVLLLIAPALFAASVYMVFSRLVVFTNGEALSPIRAYWLTKTFIFGDIISFVVQGGGGGMIANANYMQIGKDLILLGLVLQIVFFGIFLVCGGLFHRRLSRSPTPVSLQENWVKYMLALYASGVLILIRSVFRIIEFNEGFTGSIMSHEVFLYLFDSVLMLGVMVLFNFIHPGSITGLRRQGTAIQLDDTGSSTDGSAIEPK